jgi:hypothetical protein
MTIQAPTSPAPQLSSGAPAWITTQCSCPSTAQLRAVFFEKVVDASGGQIIMVGPPTADALRVAGAWPSPKQLLQRLISALETAADDETRAAEERTKFRQAAAYLGSFATQVAIGALGGAGGNILSG